MSGYNSKNTGSYKYKPPLHGGDMQGFISRHQIGHELLDLSSATNRNVYPQRETSCASWSGLPYDNKELIAATELYYGTKNIRLVPGSQWAIEHLPLIIEKLSDKSSPLKVKVPALGYSEHHSNWRKHNATLSVYEGLPTIDLVNVSDVLVVINPNNPSGQFINVAKLIELAEHMRTKGGWVIVDEAFIDFHSEYSLMPLLGSLELSRVIVLRSFGKFSGLPGARLGAIGSNHQVCCLLDDMIPLWGISGPSMEIMARVLSDEAWFEQVRQKLTKQAHELTNLLSEYFDCVNSEVLLFKTVFSTEAQLWFQALVSEGIYPRLLDNCSGIRFSIPESSAELELLESAFRRIKGRGLRCYQ